MGSRPGFNIGPRDYEVVGGILEPGAPAPDFKLMNTSFQFRTLADYEGKVKIVSCVPSVDTSVCSAQTHRFNKEAANLGEDIAVLTVSADLPYALRRYCGNEGIDRTETLSAYLDMKFADAYGVHVLDWRLCQRALFVLDQQNVVRYAEYVPIIGNEVNFEAALETAKSLAG